MLRSPRTRATLRSRKAPDEGTQTSPAPDAAGAGPVRVLGGCASFSDDGGFGSVEQLTKARSGRQVQWARSDAERERLDQRVADLLAKPLTVDDATQIALFNNRALQASFFELGVSEADLVQAGRLPNPGCSFGRLRRGNELEIDRGLHFNLARLIAMPMQVKAESQRFAMTQTRVAQTVLTLANDTRKAYFASHK